MNRVRRFSLDNPYQKRFVAEKVKNAQKVMFWGGISANHITKLIPCDGIMNSRKYIETIIDPEVASLSLSDPELILQQDNAPCHTSKSVKDFFNDKNIEVLEWPSNSPDLKIIENLWYLLKLRINKCQIRSKSQLICEAPKILNKLATKDFIARLLESIPRRIQEVIENRGGATKN